jgi:hypothetical protein
MTRTVLAADLARQHAYHQHADDGGMMPNNEGEASVWLSQFLGNISVFRDQLQ